MTLPSPRAATAPYRIELVCLGNICRSPIAEVVLTARLVTAGLSDKVQVTSSGTGDWHTGEPMDRRAAAVLSSGGYDASQHRAHQFECLKARAHDLLLTMDASNHAAVLALVPASEHDRVRPYRSFDPLASEGDLDVPDPWYGGADGFDEVLALVERTTDVLVAELMARV